MSWQLDPVHSQIGFSVKHLMISNVRGQFQSYTGAVHIDEADPTRSWAEGEIDVAGIDTRNQQRDEHLRSADFFDAANFPKIKYKTSRIEHLSGPRFRVYGDLTIHGITREIVLDAEYAGTVKDPWGGTRAAFTASGNIDRRDFGLTWNALLEAGGLTVGHEVKLELEVELIKQEAPVAVAV